VTMIIDLLISKLHVSPSTLVTIQELVSQIKIRSTYILSLFNVYSEDKHLFIQNVYVGQD